MEQSGLVVVFVTVADVKEADKIGSVLLEQRKAACVNTIPKITSRFWWQGKIDYAEEALLIIKTKASAVPEVIELVKKNHGYTVPEIIALPIIAGNMDYLEWINKEVKECSSAFGNPALFI